MFDAPRYIGAGSQLIWLNGMVTLTVTGWPNPATAESVLTETVAPKMDELFNYWLRWSSRRPGRPFEHPRAWRW